MSSLSLELNQLQKHMAASRALVDWIASTEAFVLLSAAVDCGIIDLLCTPKTMDQIVAATKIDPHRVEDILLALEAHNIVLKQDSLYQLTPNLALLASPESIQPLASLLHAVGVKIRTLQTLGNEKNVYTAMLDEDTLAIAKGSGASSLSSTNHFMGETIALAMPELKELWQTGACHLEVGCGVGNNLFQITTTYPKVTAVGLEIEAMIAEEARRRASLLGVSDRVEIRHMDACELKDISTFDTAQWSQFFFPEESRSYVLAALLRAMKPGGLVYMPVLPEVRSDFALRRRELVSQALHVLRSGLFPALPYFMSILGDTSANRRHEKRMATLERLFYHRWGIPVRTAKELGEELDCAGFEVLRAIPTPSSQFSEARGFLLVRKPAV